MNWVDGVMLVVLAGSAVAGAWRGLVFELVSLARWGLALLAAWQFADLVAAQLPWYDLPEAVLHGIGFLIVLLVVRLVLKLVALGVRALIQASVLSGVDRMLGAAFGVVRGWLLLSVACLAVMLTPLREQPEWQASRGAIWLRQGVMAIEPWISPKRQSFWPKRAQAQAVGTLFV